MAERGAEPTPGLNPDLMPEPRSGEVVGLPTMTEQEAAERAEQHIAGAVAALPDRPALTLLSDLSMECLDPDDGGPPGRYEVGRTYWLDGLPSDRNGSYVDALCSYWRSHGFRVLADTRPNDLFVSVEHDDDAFRMSVVASDDGRLSLGASSPCIWPDGTPP